MPTFKILKIEEKVSASGSKYKTLELGEKGTTNRFQNISFFGKDEIKKDDLIEGIIEKNDRGYQQLKTPFKQGQGGNGMGASMIKLQEVKTKAINEVQDKKVEGIKLSGCNRDATLILTSLGAKEDWQTKWLEIRKWLLENY